MPPLCPCLILPRISYVRFVEPGILTTITETKPGRQLFEHIQGWIPFSLYWLEYTSAISADVVQIQNMRLGIGRLLCELCLTTCNGTTTPLPDPWRTVSQPSSRLLCRALGACIKRRKSYVSRRRSRSSAFSKSTVLHFEALIMRDVTFRAYYGTTQSC